MIVLVYQVELNVLVPGVLGKEMRLHPVNILFFTLATAELFGLSRSISRGPAAALVQIVIDEFYLQPRKLDCCRARSRSRRAGGRQGVRRSSAVNPLVARRHTATVCFERKALTSPHQFQ